MKRIAFKVIKLILPYGLIVFLNKKKAIKIDRKHEYISCPICNSTICVPFRTNYEVVKCYKCKTVYLRYRMTSDEMEKYYKTVDQVVKEHNTPLNVESVLASPMRREYFMDELLEYVKPEGELLDIGCSYGAFLYLAKEKGFLPTGIELSTENVIFINRTLKIRALSTQLINAKFSAAQFSVVTMIHVLEHLPNPIEALSYVYKILKNEGLFCGIVPNIESFCSEALKDNWKWLSPTWHYTHFSVSTLRTILEESGFSVKRIYTTTGDYNIDDLYQILKSHHSDKSIKELGYYIQELNNNNWGEEIRFFAIKN